MLGTKHIGCCLALSAAMLAGDAAAQGPRANSKTITWQSPQNSQDIQVGILGEIATPGVYLVDAGTLSVQALVRRAGGLTDDASLSIRIVRQERVAQSLFFTPQADSRLLPGDVLVVESKRLLSAMSKVVEVSPTTNSIRQVASDSSDPTGVQVAYVNVFDTPIVVKLHLEDARLERVVQMLGQPIELAGAVKVIHPERAPNAVAQIASGTLRLTDGTVLIFPKGAINRNKLPSFPKPYDSAVAAGAQPAMIGGALGQSPELRSVGQMTPQIALPEQQPNSPFSSVAAPNHVAPSAIPIAPAVPAFDPEPVSAPVVSSRPRIATLPFTGAAPMRSSSRRGQIEADEIAPPPQDGLPVAKQALPTESTRSLRQSDTQYDALTNDADVSATAEPVGASPFTGLQMLGIFAGVSALIGAAFLARKQFDKQLASGYRMAAPSERPITPLASSDNDRAALPALTNDAVAPIPAPRPNPLSTSENTQENRLDRLIRNELSLREEALEFPEPLLLQGRIATRPIYRIDRAVETAIESGPHFSAPAAATHNVGEAELDVHSSNEVRVSSPHFGQRRNPTRPITIGEAQRAASAVTQDSHALHSTASSTPLADALRQLQGDRPS